jgi:hypothetical protein
MPKYMFNVSAMKRQFVTDIKSMASDVKIQFWFMTIVHTIITSYYPR